jgi:hypothetical protein
VLGEFAVDRDAFTFELRQDTDAKWRQVSMDVAMEEIAATDRLLEIEGQPEPSEVAERMHSSLTHDFPMPRRARTRRGSRMGEEGAHVLCAEEVLYRAGVPHILLPVQRDRFASNVFMVPGLLRAKIALCRGGFKQALPSHTVLIVQTKQA